MKWVRVISSVWVAAGLWGCSFDPSGNSDPGAGPPGQPGQPDAGATTADGAPRPDAEPTMPQGQLDAPSTTVPPDLDADPSDWDGIPRTAFSMSTAMHQADVVPGYTFDASVEFAARHDANNIYFLIQVTDDVLVNDSTVLYHDDSIHLYFDVAGDASGPYSADDHWLVVTSDAVYGSFPIGAVELDLSGSVESGDTGYTVELGIPKQDLGMSPAQGLLGFNIGLSDDDGMGGPDRDAFGLWYLPAGPRCPSCCEQVTGAQPWCDTTMFGTLALLP